MATHPKLTPLGLAVTPRNVAHASLIALEIAEAAITGSRDAHSRLYVAVMAVDNTVSFLSFPTESGRIRLRARLEDLQRVESNALALRQLAPDSIIQRGISLAIFVVQTALAGVSYQPEHALHEAQAIVRLAGRQT